MRILYLRSRVHRFESCRGRHFYLASYETARGISFALVEVRTQMRLS
jgi:hypothetical protein